VSVRDFLLLFFFIDLGSRLELTMVGPQILNAVYLSLFVLIGNPLIVMAIMGVMGYRRRTGFLAGLAVAQISEFSLILAALGLSLGHINMETMSLVTLVGVITICMSTYLIIYSGTFYRWFEKPMKIFERKHPYREQLSAEGCIVPDVDFLLIGLGNYGSGLARHLIERGKRIAGVDFNPQVLESWSSKNVPVVFGDVGDPEFLDNLPLNCSSWVVSTVRERNLNTNLLYQLQERGYEGKIALTAMDEEEAKNYTSNGAHVVLKPFDDASEEAADSLTEAMHLLPEGIDWPLALKEIRLKKSSTFAGQFISNLNLRNDAGISILAVSRAGRVHLDPDPGFQLFPGDRLVLMGEQSSLKHAEEILQETEDERDLDEPRHFATAEVDIGIDSPNSGHSLAEVKFRKTYGATVIGIIRGHERIPMPRPEERLEAGDRLIVIGTPKSIEKIKKY
jgi:Trk K+ transport system NAD-binding subunit